MTDQKPKVPLWIGRNIFWYDDGCGMGGVYYEDCGVASELPAAIWSEDELLLVVNHMRKLRGADPIIPADYSVMSGILQSAATEVGAVTPDHPDHDMIVALHRFFIDLSDRIRNQKQAERFWTRQVVDTSYGNQLDLPRIEPPKPSTQPPSDFDRLDFDLWDFFPDDDSRHDSKD